MVLAGVTAAYDPEPIWLPMAVGVAPVNLTVIVVAPPPPPPPLLVLAEFLPHPDNKKATKAKAETRIDTPNINE
jgi:hypothetical protein